MFTKLDKRLKYGLILGVILALIVTVVALADDISNNLDSSVDAVAEVMPLTLGGGNGTTNLYVVEQNGDGKNGCNLTGSTILKVGISSSDISVATVSPAEFTFTSCGADATLTISSIGEGSATISLSLIQNTTAGSFNLNPATFTVNVSNPTPVNNAPTIQITGVEGGAEYEVGFVPSAVCEVSDEEDGDSSFPASLSEITGDLSEYGLGFQTASCEYTDGGDLTAEASVTYSIVDTTDPVITFVSRTLANGNGWNNGDVTVNWSCSDSGSGVLAALVSQTESTEGENQSATGTCEDHAGNTSSDTVTGINIDKTAPSASASASPAPNANGWNKTDVTVSFSGNDGTGSGIDFCDADVVLTSEGADQSASGTCTDLAGNVSDPAIASDINIDKTAPAFGACPSGGPFILNSGSQSVGPISVNAAISGLNAGLSTLSGSVDTSSIGTKTVGFTAVDNADNSETTSCSYSVIYNWSGFFQPVDNAMLNIAKAGSAIPVKFSLSGDQGLGILFAGYPTSKVISCDAYLPTDSIETYTTTANNGLVYDAVADQYNYVWKTEKAWAGTCREFTLKLIDGTEHKAKFKFNK